MGSKQIQIGLLLEEKTETQLRVEKGHMKVAIYKPRAEAPEESILLATDIHV